MKVGSCAAALSRWGKVTFGDVKKWIKLKEEELQVWQDKAPDGLMIARCKEIAAELDDLQRLHESYWHARARANELRDGDKNTRYFHHKASQRKIQNTTIHKLRNKDVEWAVETDEMMQIISEYFSDIFVYSLPSELDAAVAGIEVKLPESANATLIAEPSADEI